MPQLMPVESNPPVALNCAQPAACEVIAKVVVVAFESSEEPRSVVDPNVFANNELRAPLTVVEPVTAKLVDVAPLSDVPPRTVSAALRLVAPATFKTEPMVEEPVIAKLVVVPFVPKKLPRVDEAEYKPPNAFNIEEIVVEPVTASEVEVAPWRLVAPVTVSDESVVAPAVTEPKVAPPVALNWPETVVEPVTAKLVEVAPVVVSPPLNTCKLLQVLRSESSVVEAVLSVAVMVTGLEPRMVKLVHEAEPEHEAVVVAVA